MRLSEMTNEVCIEKVIEITPYLGEIMQDEELISIFYDRLDITDMDEKEGKIKGWRIYGRYSERKVKSA